MKRILLLSIAFPLLLSAQKNKKDTVTIPKQANTIIVKDVLFDNIVNALLDNGYSIEKIDSNYKTIKTEFLKCPLKSGKPSLINLSISVRYKDSAAIITGKWYNDISIAFEKNSVINPMYILKSCYTYGSEKLSFLEMDKIAHKLSDKIEYVKQ